MKAFSSRRGDSDRSSTPSADSVARSDGAAAAPLRPSKFPDINQSPRMLAQRRALKSIFGSAIRLPGEESSDPARSALQPKPLRGATVGKESVATANSPLLSSLGSSKIEHLNQNKSSIVGANVAQRTLLAQVSSDPKTGEPWFEKIADLIEIGTFIMGQGHLCKDDVTKKWYRIVQFSDRRPWVLLQEYGTQKEVIYDYSADTYRSVPAKSDDAKPIERVETKPVEPDEKKHEGEQKADSKITVEKVRVLWDHPLGRHRQHLVGRGNHSTFIGGEAAIKRQVNLAINALKIILAGKTFNAKGRSCTIDVKETVGFQSDVKGVQNGFPQTSHITIFYNLSKAGTSLLITTAYPGAPYDQGPFGGDIQKYIKTK